ncbi:hypothetical protein [Citrobacter koseri]|uniref:hypothetical protein n=1 Tax=Citrobacter koseri TaxID=545 RepID=UPI003D06A1F8
MKNLIFQPVMSFVLLTLVGCSQNQLMAFQQQLSDVSTMMSPGEQQLSEKQAERNEVVRSFSLPVGVATAALRLKQHYGFSSDDDVAAARNNGQGNAGWSASAISEGASWSAQPGAWYRMSRNWAGNDRLTLEVRGDAKHSNVTATYLSSTPEHLKPEWTARLWKQIPEVASGRTVTHGGAQ